MKPLSKKTQRTVADLRNAKAAHEALYGDTSLGRVLGAAISRLCLLDCALQALAQDTDSGPRSLENVKDVASGYLEAWE